MPKMRLFLITVRTAILYIFQSKIEKGDPKHKKGTQIPKKVPMGTRIPKRGPSLAQCYPWTLLGLNPQRI